MRVRLGIALLVVAASAAACSTGAAPPPGLAAHAPSHAAGSPASRSQGRAKAVTGPPVVRVRVLPWQLPDPVSREVAMAYRGRLLVVGGLGPGDITTAQAWTTDPSSGRTHRSPGLAVPVHDAAGGVVRGRPTVVGGGSSVSLSDVQQRSRSGGWGVVGRLQTVRSDLSAAAVGGGLLVVGGYDGVHSPRAVLETSDGQHFRTVARLPHGVRYAGVALLDGNLWVLGGEESGRELHEVWRVDLATGRVTAVGRLPRALGHEAVVAVGHRLLVLGGRTTPDTMTDAMWWFTPATGRWRRAGRLPYPLADAPAARVRGATYLVGGETPHFTAHVLRVTVH